MQEALPPELRAVYEPLAHKLANVLRSDALVPTMRRLLALLGSSLSHLATEVMLKPRGRRQLRRGLLAFAETCPSSLRPLLYTLADPTLCLLGLRGTQLLCDAMRLESGVRAERLFELEGEIGAASDRPPRRVEHPEVGQMVRVLIAEAAAHPQPGCSAGLFRARILAEEPPSRGGMAPTYVIEYMDEVALVAGKSCVGAEYHIFDYIPELRCHWLLWLRGLQVDLKMPVLGSSKSPTDASAGGGSGGGLPEQLLRAHAGSGSGSSHGGSSGGVGGPEVIRATWHEPTAAEREAGQMGALTLHARIAHVHVRARVERGRFWSDNPLMTSDDL